MSATQSKILVTGATGHLGRLAVEALLAEGAEHVVAGARRPDDKALKGLGVETREVDYTRPETLDAAFDGIDRLLLVSSSEVGKRAPQHRNVIEATKRAGVGRIVYTSILHADTNPMQLGLEHRDTEAALKQSGLAFTSLRNGWYHENYTANAPVAVEHGAVLGSAREGRISSAPRADYALAAARVLLADDDRHAGQLYELGGDESYTLARYAELLAERSGKPVVFKNLPEAEFKQALVGMGLPDGFAGAVADADARAADDVLFDDSRKLGELIGRPTGSMSDAVAKALAS